MVSMSQLFGNYVVFGNPVVDSTDIVVPLPPQPGVRQAYFGDLLRWSDVISRNESHVWRHLLPR